MIQTLAVVLTLVRPVPAPLNVRVVPLPPPVHVASGPACGKRLYWRQGTLAERQRLLEEGFSWLWGVEEPPEERRKDRPRTPHVRRACL